MNFKKLLHIPPLAVCIIPLLLLSSTFAQSRDEIKEEYKWNLNDIYSNWDDWQKGLEELIAELVEFPSIQFGLETAFKSLKCDDVFELFPSKFTRSEDTIPINGLVWMGDEAFMKQQIKEKIEADFSCIKMKIGAIDFQTEINLLKSIRNEFSSKDNETYHI